MICTQDHTPPPPTKILPVCDAHTAALCSPPKGGQKSVFFTLVSPMNDDKGMEETPCDLTKPRIAPYNNAWKPLQNTVYWCNLMRAQKRGLQFCQTRSHAIVPCNTLLAICIENAVCMKTKEEGYLKVCLTPKLPRAVLKPNSRSGQQDQQEQDARSSCDLPCGSKGFGETWCNNVDNRTPGILPSAFEQLDTNRRHSQKVDSAVREPPEQRIHPSGLQTDGEDQ